MPIEKPNPQPGPGEAGGLFGAIQEGILRIIRGVAQGAWEFFSGIIGRGLEIILDVIGEPLVSITNPLIDKVLAQGTLPPEEAEALRRIRTEHGEYQALIRLFMSGSLLVGAVSTVLGPVYQNITFRANALFRPRKLDPPEAIRYTMRTLQADTTLLEDMRSLGYSEERIKAWFEIMRPLLDRDTVFRLGLRHPEDPTRYDGDLMAAGWYDWQIAAAKELYQIIPGVQDLMRMGIRDAFSSKVVEQFRYDEDFPVPILEWAKKIGLDEFWVRRFWWSHWDLPGTNQGFEMFQRLRPEEAGDHQGLTFTREDLELLLRTADMAPYFRDRLTEIAYNPLTRVDIRRMWYLNVLDDDEVRRAYRNIGYSEPNAIALTTFTRLYQSLPDLRRRFSNGWLTSQQLLDEIIALGLSPERAELLRQTLIKTEKPARTQPERDLTRADIISGVKRDVLGRDQATVLLEDLGYDPEEADYILEISIPSEDTDAQEERRKLSKSEILQGLKQGVIDRADALRRLILIRYDPTEADLLIKILEAQARGVAPPEARALSKEDITAGVKKGVITPEEGFRALLAIGYADAQASYILTVARTAPKKSPQTPSEFRALTQRWRAAQGLDSKIPKPELIDAERLVYALRQVLEDLQQRGASRDDIGAARLQLESAEAAYHELVAAEESS